MGRKSKNTQTQTQTITPDPITDQWRNQVFSQGNSMLAQGAPQQSFGAQTLQGFDALRSGAQQVGQSAQGATGVLQGQTQAWNPWASVIGNGYGGDNINPYAAAIYKSASAPVMDDVNAQFARAGRYGPSAAYGKGMTSALGDLSNNIYGAAYENERNRGLQAQQAAAGLYNQDVSNQQRAAALLPSMWAGLMMPGQTQTEIGQMYDAQDFANQNAPWERLQQYANMMNGLPNLSTTSTTGVNTQQNRSGFLDYLGTAAKIGSMFV